MSAATSTTQSHSSAHTTAARAQAANPRKPGASGHGPETGTDLFAAMLSLLSATTDIPPDTALAADAAPGEAANPLLTATDAPTDPLAGLLGWPGAPLSATPPAAASLSSSVSAPAPGVVSNNAPLLPSGTTPGVASTLAPPPSPPGVDLQGMQRLEQPATPDEQTLAALALNHGTAPNGVEGDARVSPSPSPSTSPSPATTPAPAAADKTLAGAGLAGAAPASPAPSEPASASRPTAWRSTVNGTSSVQQQHATQSLGHSLSERLQVRLETGLPLALRSTVTLDERFNTASTSDSPALSAGPAVHGQASASGAGGFAGEQPSGGGDSGPDRSSALATDTEAPDESTRFDDALTDQNADEGLGAWSSSPTLRQASLRVGGGGEEAIDIQLSMKGQELNVAFRTDNADARAELREHAGESLADLLQRSGIQLGDVSVGSQGQQQARGEPGEPRPQRPSNARSGSVLPANNTPAPVAVSPRPRSDGGPALDMFV